MAQNDKFEEDDFMNKSLSDIDDIDNIIEH